MALTDTISLSIPFLLFMLMLFFTVVGIATKGVLWFVIALLCWIAMAVQLDDLPVFVGGTIGVIYGLMIVATYRQGNEI